ncbi:MAG: glycosyltransferase family 4 protein [Solirubrobacteraceae bacterium]
MRVAIVASSFAPGPGTLERRTDQLARGLAARGVEVEVLAQGMAQPLVDVCGRVPMGRFPAAVRRLRLPATPGLWDRGRLTVGAFDLVDVHARHGSIALAVAYARPRRLVFSPGASVDALLRWPRVAAMRAVMARADRIVCRSEVDRDLLGDAIPAAAGRTRVVPDGVDLDAMHEAEPYATTGAVVLAVDGLDRGTWVDRAIAAVPGLAPEFSLVVVGDGGSRGRLTAYAADLRVASRVRFVGAVPDAVLYRWLRTARVVVTLGRSGGTGAQVTEARAAGASLVASDLPINREAAECPSGGHVIFVSADASPLDVADAIEEAAAVSVLPSTSGAGLAPSWQSVVDSTLLLYGQLIGDGSVSERADAHGALVSLAAEAARNGDGVAVSGRSGAAGGTG